MSCIQGWACLMSGERFGPVVEAWRASSPGEKVKEAQSLGKESVWSSPRKRDTADLSLGRESERVVPRGEDQKASVLGERVIPKGQCQKRSSPAPAPCPSLPGPAAVGHLPPQQQPHGLRGGVREDIAHAVLLVPADPEHLPVAGGQRQRAVGAGAVPDAGLARGLPLHPARHRLHRQGESGARPCRARAGRGEGKGALEGNAGWLLFLGVTASPPEHPALLPCQVAAETGSTKTLSDTEKIIQKSPSNTASSLQNRLPGCWP